MPKLLSALLVLLIATAPSGCGTPDPEAIVVPEGATVTTVLLSPVGSDISRPNESFAVTMIEPLIFDDRAVVSHGYRIIGRVREARPSTGSGPPMLTLEFTALEEVDGMLHPIQALPLRLVGVTEDEARIDAGAPPRDGEMQDIQDIDAGEVIEIRDGEIRVPTSNGIVLPPGQRIVLRLVANSPLPFLG